MPKFRGYLRRLIIRAEEGFHGWEGIYICLLWSMLPFYSEWGEPLLAWQLGDSHKRTRKLCCAIGLFSRVTFSTNDMSWIQFSIRPQWLCTFVLLQARGDGNSQHWHWLLMRRFISNGFSGFHFAAAGSQNDISVFQFVGLQEFKAFQSNCLMRSFVISKVKKLCWKYSYNNKNGLLLSPYRQETK